jgi:transposase-like protein
MIPLFQGPEFRKDCQIMQVTDSTEKTICAALLERFVATALDDTACRDLLLSVLQPGQTVCPECGSSLSTNRQEQTFRSGGRVCCKECGRWFDHRTGTILSGTTLSVREIIYLVLLLGQGLPIKTIANRMDLHEGTVRDWRERVSITAPLASYSKG